MKRIISTFLCVIMVISLLPTSFFSKNVTAAAKEKTYEAGKSTETLQYGYEETDKDSVTVKINISNNGIPLSGKDGGTILANLEVTVPYFDLKLYNMESYYRYGTTNGRGEYTDTTLIQRPTALHLMIWLTERYYFGLEENECGKGLEFLKENGYEFDKNYGKDIILSDMYGNLLESDFSANEAFRTSGDAGHCLINAFWGHGLNFMYYRNHVYPMMEEGVGATCDYILLSDGDAFDMALFTDMEFYSRGAFAVFTKDSYTAKAGEKLDLNVLTFSTSAKNENGYGAFDVAADKRMCVEIYEGSLGTNCPMDEEWEVKDGKVTVQLSPGTYYVMAKDVEGGTNQASYAPAITKVLVTENAALPATIIEKIEGIGEVTLSSKKLLDEIETLYGCLTKEQKKKVTNYDIFKEAKELCDKLVSEVKEKVGGLIASITELGEITAEKEEQVMALLSQYEELTEEEKVYVTNGVTLLEAKDSFKAWKKTASQIETMITGIGTVTPDRESYITSVRYYYEKLTDNEKYYVSEEKVKLLEEAESTLAQWKEQQKQEEQEIEKAKDLVKKIANLGTITPEKEESVRNLKSLYVTLPEGKRALVTNYNVLTAAENTLAAWKKKAMDLEKVIQSIGTVTLEKETLIFNARSQYNNLSANEKYYVSSANLTLLSNAEAALSTLKKKTDGDNSQNNSGSQTVSSLKKGDKVTVSGAVYKITNIKTRTVEYVKRSKSAKNVVIPATVKIKGKSYKVTSIGANAFAKDKKLTAVTIGKNVKTIGKKAFYNCKNLKNIKISTTILAKNNVKASAFSGIYKKATFKVPKGKGKAYKKILLARGAKKTIKVK